MKIYYRESIPESVFYNKHLYVPAKNQNIYNETEAYIILNTLEQSGMKCVIVSVSSRRLRGKVDKNDLPFKPTIWVFTRFHKTT